ncbi:MAG: SufD family Fe-S cluster assembly protein [Candidatus Nanopelagicales bacterium]
MSTTDAPTNQPLKTDHSRAQLAGDHSHVIVPDASRADRVTSFDPETFGVPNGREENWRFSPVRDLKQLFSLDTGEGHLEWHLPELPAGVTFSEVSADEAQARSVKAPADRASAIATAKSGGAAVLSIAPGAQVDEPIVIEQVGSGEDARGHVLIEAGDGSSAAVIIKRTGSAVYSEFVSVDVSDNAFLGLVLMQDWDDDAIHAGEVVAKLGANAHLRGFVITLGGKVVRLNTSAAFAGIGGEIELFGLYFADAGQHQEHQLFVDHAVPRCKSRVTYKGALAGETAHTVWIGDVLIRAAAEGTDTYELNRNIVLTDGARADSVPNLEIETGEIEGAGHASATGRFDEEQMFYLQARGIDVDVARRLVLRGFFADVVDEINSDQVRETVWASIDQEIANLAALEAPSGGGS